MNSRLVRSILIGSVAFLAAAGMTACRGERTDKPPRQFFPDMDDQPRFKPQSQTQFFEDGRTMRQPPEGSVAFGYSASIMEADWNATNLLSRAALLKDEADIYFGNNPDGTPVARVPVEVTPELLARGAERFGIFCSACHGFNAEGATPNAGGMAGRKWAAPVPSLHGEQYQIGGEKGADGYLFSVIRNGVWGVDGANRMPGYAHAVDEHDAWAIVAHLRVLQAARKGSLDVLDVETRQHLESTRVVVPGSGAAPAASSDGNTP